MQSRMGSVLAAAFLMTVAGAAAAQQPSATTTTEMGKPTTTSSTRHISGKIVSVDGNKVVVERQREHTGIHRARGIQVPDGWEGHRRRGPQAGNERSRRTVTTTTTSTPVTVTQIRKGEGPRGLRPDRHRPRAERHPPVRPAGPRQEARQAPERRGQGHRAPPAQGRRRVHRRDRHRRAAQGRQRTRGQGDASRARRPPAPQAAAAPPPARRRRPRPRRAAAPAPACSPGEEASENREPGSPDRRRRAPWHSSPRLALTLARRARHSS